MELQNELALLSDLFTKRIDIRLVYLFGSQAAGRSTAASDCDLAVLFEPEASFQEQISLKHIIEQHLVRSPVDLLALNRAPSELAFHIITYGKCLYQATLTERVEFEAQVMSVYYDYLPVLREQRKQILQGENHERRVQRYRETLRRTQRTLRQAGPARRT